MPVFGEATGLYAIRPDAFGQEYAAAAPRSSLETVANGRIAVLRVAGPLCYAAAVPVFESYEGIVARVRQALASDVDAVAIRYDSPGGEVFGAFDAARAIRAAAAAAGKPLIAHVGAQACSAAYALACACDRVFVSSSGVLGSIGVIAASVDLSRAESAAGMRWTIVTSGERKADGNPHVPISENTKAAMVRSVDKQASLFFELVQDMRGVDAAPLQAGLFIGSDAVAAGLGDHVCSWEELCVQLSDPDYLGAIQSNSPTTTIEASNMADKDSEKDEKAKAAAEDKKEDASARSNLEKAAAGGDARAKRALAAYDADEDKKDKSKSEDEKDKDKAAAEDKKEDAKAEFPPKKDEDKAQAVASAAMTELGKANARIAALEATAVAAQFAALRAERPDVGEKLWEELIKLPFANAKALVDAQPRTGNPLAPPVLASNPALGAAGSTPTLNALSAAMGLTGTKVSNVNTPQTLSLGVITQG